MDCALWLNRRKIYTAAEIQGNLDVASLRGYLLGGALIEWLNEHGGKRYANKLAKLSPDDEKLNEKIAAVFGTRPSPFKELNGSDTGVDFPVFGDQSGTSSAVIGSMLLSSYPIGHEGSYNYAALSSFGSFADNSYTFGSNISWEQWLSALFGGGSFSLNSFTFTSGVFHEWEWEWLYRLLFGYGSFSAGSFAFGSFILESLLKLFRSRFGSFGGSGSFGSLFPAPDALPFDEYDLIMLKTLADCPLDRFGYGIHNI